MRFGLEQHRTQRMLFQLLLLLLLRRRPWGLNNFAVQRETLSLLFHQKLYTIFSDDFGLSLSLSLCSVLSILCAFKGSRMEEKGGTKLFLLFLFFFFSSRKCSNLFPIVSKCASVKKIFQQKGWASRNNHGRGLLGP